MRIFSLKEKNTHNFNGFFFDKLEIILEYMYDTKE